MPEATAMAALFISGNCPQSRAVHLDLSVSRLQAAAAL
jgi:hypothetical protein